MIESQKELDAAKHLLGHYGYQQPRAGSFTTKLIECLEAADPANKARLLHAFPEWRPAIGIMGSLGGEALEAIVRDVEQVQIERAARAAAAEAAEQAARTYGSPVTRKMPES